MGGKKRLLPVDTVVICAGNCIALQCCVRAAFPRRVLQDKSRCATWKRV